MSHYFETTDHEQPCAVCGTPTRHVEIGITDEPLCSVECERSSELEYQHILELLRETDLVLEDW